MSSNIDPYLEKQYNNRLAVPHFADYINSWAERSAEYRAIHAGAILDLEYDDSERALLDIFPAIEANAPVHIFIHGGYWKMLSKDSFSFVAKRFNQLGETAVVLNYALCPSVGIADIIRQIRQAVRWVNRHIVEYGGDPTRCQVTGHSAGGHLVGCLLTEDWSDIGRGCPPVSRLNALSGLFDLNNLVPTSVNDVLGLTQSNADSLSPLLQPMHCENNDLQLNLRVGDQESDEYKKQSRSFSDAWSGRLSVTNQLYAGIHHFTIVDHFLDHDYRPL